MRHDPCASCCYLLHFSLKSPKRASPSFISIPRGKTELMFEQSSTQQLRLCRCCHTASSHVSSSCCPLSSPVDLPARPKQYSGSTPRLALVQHAVRPVPGLICLEGLSPAWVTTVCAPHREGEESVYMILSV